MDLQLQDRHALVTGSTAGIGYLIAETRARRRPRRRNGRSHGAVDSALAAIRAATGRR